jgi:DnaJ-class molecular chaperone
MPIKENPDNFGNLHITMKVMFPESMTKAQIKLLDEIFADKAPVNEESDL